MMVAMVVMVAMVAMVVMVAVVAMGIKEGKALKDRLERQEVKALKDQAEAKGLQVATHREETGLPGYANPTAALLQKR